MSMINLPIIPRVYIDRPSSLLCRICFLPSEEMLICRGACQSTYCAACFAVNGMQACPNYCSPNSNLELLKGQKLTYSCPYPQCQEKLHSEQQFWKHCESCQLINEEAKAELEYRKNYLCRQGHKLYFITEQNFYEVYTQGSHYYTTNSERCSYCKAQFLSKSICLECGIGKDKGVYCIYCRPIPCERQSCPIGHTLTITVSYGSGMMCDFCGVRAKVYGGDVYSDRTCNFDICRICHEKVPQKHHLTPLNNIIPEDKRIKKEQKADVEQYNMDRYRNYNPYYRRPSDSSDSSVEIEQEQPENENENENQEEKEQAEERSSKSNEEEHAQTM